MLELGSGWSTMVLAKYANDSGAFLESLESEPHFYYVTHAGLSHVVSRKAPEQPSIRAKEWYAGESCRCLLSPIMNSSEDSIRYGYQCLSQPDFVYVDGPIIYGKRVYVDNVFPPHLDGSRPMCFYVDGRVQLAASLWLTYRKLGHPYEWHYSAESQCSLIFHEAYASAGKWFKDNHKIAPNPIRESENGRTG